MVVNILGILKMSKHSMHLFNSPKRHKPQEVKSFYPRLINVCILRQGDGWREEVCGLYSFYLEKGKFPPTHQDTPVLILPKKKFLWMMDNYYINTDNIDSKVLQSCTTLPPDHWAPFGFLHVSVRVRWLRRMG